MDTTQLKEFTLTIGNVVKWEGITGKSFNEFSLADPEHVKAMIYITMFPRESTLSMVEEMRKSDAEYYNKLYTKFVRNMQTEMAYIAQFIKQKGNDAKKDKNSPEEPHLLTDIVADLSGESISVDWILSCTLDELPFLNEIVTKIRHREMESKRFWARIAMSPYMDKEDAKKSLSEFLPFDWEKDANGNASSDEISERDIAIAHALFGKKTTK